MRRRFRWWQGWFRNRSLWYCECGWLGFDAILADDPSLYCAQLEPLPVLSAKLLCPRCLKEL